MSTLRTVEIFNDSRFRLIAVQASDLRHGKSNAVAGLYGKMEPVALVVCGSDEIYALDMNANPVELSELQDIVADLDIIGWPVEGADTPESSLTE